MDPIYAFLPGILVLGAVTSYTDIRYGKIRNNMILFGLGYSILVNIILVAFQVIGYLDIAKLLLSSGIALAFGIFIWLAGLWSAGDAKLFFAFSMLVPMSAYQFSEFPYFQAIIILINTFIPMFIYYLYLCLTRTTTQQKIDVFKKFKLRLIGMIFLYFFVGDWILTLILGPFNIDPGFFGRFVFFFLFIETLSNKSMKMKIALLILAIIRAVFDYETISSGQFILMSLKLVASYIVLRYFVLNLSYEYLTEEVQIERLKPGMVLAERIIKEKDKKDGKEKVRYHTEKNIFYSLNSLFRSTTQSQAIEYFPEGLNKENIKELQKLHSSGRFSQHSVRISHTIPFAPFMFIGIILLLLNRGNFLNMVKIYWIRLGLNDVLRLFRN